MAYTIEIVGSREANLGEQPTRTILVDVLGTDDESLVETLAKAATEPTFHGLYRNSVHLEQEGTDVWHAEVGYGGAKLPEPGTPGEGTIEWAFEISGGRTQHISQSLETIHKYGISPVPQDFKGALNVRQDGNGFAVDGLDIDETTFAWTETHHMLPAALTTAYLNTLYSMRGKVNEDAWRIFAKGEVRLVSIHGSPKGEWDLPLTFGFEASHNVADLVVGDINGIEKEGWQYLWPYYRDTKDTAANKLVKTPESCYVEKIFEYGTFADLGLPDPWSS